MTQGSDTFAGAPLIPEGMITAATPTSGLSMALEQGEQGWHNAAYTMSRTAWWKFTATSTGDISINLLHSENVADWDAVQFAMVALYTGDELATLAREDYAYSSDHWYTGLGNSPEILGWVEEGVTYHVQALLRNTSPNIDYRLQVVRYIDTVTDWIELPDFQYEVPRVVDGDGDLVANISGTGKMWDNLDPSSISDFGSNPDTPLLNSHIEDVMEVARLPENGSNAWSSEAATLVASVGQHRVIDPNAWPFPTVDESTRNYSAAYREFTYGFRYYNALLRHRFEYDPNDDNVENPDIPEWAVDYEWEGNERSQALEASVEFLIFTDSEEGTFLGGYTKPAGLSHKFQIRTSGDRILPPMPTVSNSGVAASLTTWESLDNNLILAEVGFGNEATSLHRLDMTDYINTDGTFVVAGWTSNGWWEPLINEEGYALRAKAHLKISDVDYLMRPPRRRWTVRQYQTGYGRLKVNVGSQRNPIWKFANPKPGENEGFGRLKVRASDGTWQRAEGKLNVMTSEGWKPS